MTLPQIYEDAISCFCPRTAWEMRRLVEKYLLNGERPAGLARFGKAPAAMLRLILMNVDLIDQSDRSIKSIDQVEEEIKRRNRDGKNIVSLSPGPSITDTRKGENREEKKKGKEEFFFIAREENNNNSASAREKNFSGSENKISENLTTNFYSSIPLEKSLALIYPDDPAEMFRLKLLKKTRDEQHRQMEELSQCNHLIDYYNNCVGIRLQQVIERYPALIETARKALVVLGCEKAKKVTDNALKSRFLCGENKLGFKADFIWIYDEKHYYKILNNEYYECRHIDLEGIQREHESRDFLTNEFYGNYKHKHLDETLW